MSLLVKIATRADVPLESVVRVLTREPVSDADKARVLEVLDDLDAEEARVLQRFALAAVHDVLPRPGDHELVVGELEDDPLELPEKVVLELEAGDEEDAEEAEELESGETLPATIDPAPLVQLGSVLGELTEAVRELRQETDAERRERVDDLAVLIDLITKGWEGVDRRLGRVERQLGRLESAPRQAEIPARVEPPPIPEPDPPPPPPAGEAGEGSTLRKRLPIIAALAFGIAVGAVAALDLPSRLDASSVIADRSTAEAAQRAPLPQTVADQSQELEPPSTTPAPEREVPPAKKPAAPKPPAATAPATTTESASPPTTTQGEPASRPAPPAAPATTKATTQAARPTAAPPRTTTTTQATTVAPTPSDFTPSRNWAWPPIAGADYYLVEFFRGGQSIYRARPTEARLTLPDSVAFTPGAYRWRVRPGHGAPAENRLDEPIVDSEFVLSR